MVKGERNRAQATFSLSPLAFRQNIHISHNTNIKNT